MTNLPANTTTTSPAIRSPEPPLNDKLVALLVSGESKIIGPNTAAALREWIPQAEAWEAALERPTRERLESMIARLSVATAKAKMSPAEAQEAHELYWAVLAPVPLIDLAAAYRELLRTATFMPKPAEILSIAQRPASLRAYRISRAKHLVWKHEVEWVPPVTEPVSIADVRAVMARAFARPTEPKTTPGEALTPGLENEGAAQ